MKRCFPITRSKMKKPTRRPPASALQMRPACTSAKLDAEGNACFCASGIVRYWTACAAEPTDMTTAAGMVQCTHFVMLHLLRRGLRISASEEESDAAEKRVRVRAERVIVLYFLIGRLEHDLG